MDKIIVGTTVVGGLLGWNVLKNRDSYQKILEKKYGRTIMDGVGYFGGALQLWAVVAVSRGWVSNTSVLYHGVSFVGSSGLLATAYYHDALAPVLVNMIWMGMNMVGMIEGISNQDAIGLLVNHKSYLPSSA
jgi:hypothetical protein